MLKEGVGAQTGFDSTSISTFRYLGIVSLCIVIVSASLFLIQTATAGSFNQIKVYFCFFAAIPVIAAWSAYRAIRSTNSAWGLGTDNRLTEVLGKYLPLAILIYGLWGINETLYHSLYRTIIDAAGFTSSWRRFLLGCLATAALIAGMVWLRLHGEQRIGLSVSESTLARFRYAFLGIFLVSLFNVDIGHDSLSYDPYIGPASAVALGSIPMVDVFSQYGLNYLLLTLCLKVMPWSMYSMSLAITVLNLVYYLGVVLICLRLCRDKNLATALSAFLILFLVSSALYNAAYTPSVLALRFLPGVLLLLALCHLKDREVFSRFSVLALCLSSLWSFEAMIFSTITYGAYLVAIILQTRPIAYRKAVASLLGLGGLILAPHILLVVGYELFLGMLPRYDIYLQLVFTQTASSSWIVPADDRIRTWVILGFSYALALAYALFRSWLSRSKPAGQANRYALIAAVSALGGMQMSYYAGRAVTPVLVFIAFPLLIIFVMIVDDYVHTLYEQATPRSFHERLTIGLVVCMLIACGGVIGDRFFREPFAPRSNGTLLRSCLSLHGGEANCISRMTRQIREKLRQPAGFVLPNGTGVTDENQAAWQLIPTGMTLEDISGYLLAKKWLAKEKRIFLFIPDAATVLFALKKQNALQLTHSMVDDRSSLLRDRAMAVARQIPEGTIIMVGDMVQQAIEREIYAYLQERWMLERIDGMHSIVVYRLRAKS